MITVYIAQTLGKTNGELTYDVRVFSPGRVFIKFDYPPGTVRWTTRDTELEKAQRMLGEKEREHGLDIDLANEWVATELGALIDFFTRDLEPWEEGLVGDKFYRLCQLLASE